MGVFGTFLPPPLATPNPDNRLDGSCNRGMAGPEKGRTKAPPDELEGAPMGAVGAAGSGSGTGGGANGGGRMTVSGSVGVAYQWSHASILDATAA